MPSFINETKEEVLVSLRTPPSYHS